MWVFMWRPAGRAADRRLLVPDTDSMIVLNVPAVSLYKFGCVSLCTHSAQTDRFLTGPGMSAPLISRMPPARSDPAVREPSH